MTPKQYADIMTLVTALAAASLVIAIILLLKWLGGLV